MKFCEKCGRQMSDDDSFCPSCGAKVNNLDDNTSITTSSDVKKLIEEYYSPDEDSNSSAVYSNNVAYTAKESSSTSHVHTSYHTAVIVLLGISLALTVFNFFRLFDPSYVRDLYDFYFGYHSGISFTQFESILAISKCIMCIEMIIRFTLIILVARKRMLEEHFSVGFSIILILFGSIVSGVVALIERTKN